MIAEPPVLLGAVHESVKVPFEGAAASAVGASAAATGVVDCNAGTLSPAAVSARTAKI